VAVEEFVEAGHWIILSQAFGDVSIKLRMKKLQAKLVAVTNMAVSSFVSSVLGRIS
jgi:hypothetical protein